jgi:predicted negative regulator of RcsB-dependent stress response
MPKAIKKRITKKTSGTEDDVKDKLTAFKDRVKEREKSVLKYGIGILLILIVAISFSLYHFTSQKKARNLEYEAYKIYTGTYQAQSMKNEEQYKKALELFQKAYDTKKSFSSLWYIAASYYDLGQYDDALKSLNTITQKYSRKDWLLPLVYQKIATVHIKKGDTDKALQALDTLFKLKSTIYKDYALMEYGRLLAKQGRAEDAKQRFKELATRFPNSPFAEEIKAEISDKKEE